MVTYLHIAAARLEGLFWLLLVLATIIVQIIKASKRAAQSERHVKPAPLRPMSPEGELQRFMESLTGVEELPPGQQPAEEKEVVETVPSFAQAAPPERIETVVRPPEPAVEPLQRLPTPSTPLVSRFVSTPRIESPAFEAYAITGTLGHVAGEKAAEVVSDLKNPGSLRKAIVLREILGPSAALRGPYVRL